MLRGLQITSYQGQSTGLGGQPGLGVGVGGRTSRVLGQLEEDFSFFFFLFTESTSDEEDVTE